MSQGSSDPASPSRPVLASEQQETITPASHVFGLSEVSTSLEALNIEVERKPTVVHCAQTSYSPGASRTPWSPNTWDSQRSTPASPQKPKRYALQIWLEVEVGPGYFIPPEDDSYSTDFTLEALNHAYPGCTEVYLDRGGHMLAFYGWKSSPKAGLIQEVAIEVGHAVTEIPTWMGLTARMEVSVVAMQKRLKEAFAVARHFTSQEAARQRCYYDRKAGAVALQPGDVVMVHTDGFVGKRKVKDRWEDEGFIVESQLENWPVYKVRCPTSDAKQKPKYRILHRNHLLLVTNEDDPVVPGQSAQAKVSPVVSNATPEAAVEDEGPSGPLPSLLTWQEGEMTSRVWLNGEFCLKPWTKMTSRASESPPDQPGDEVSDLESGMSDSESEGT